MRSLDGLARFVPFACVVLLAVTLLATCRRKVQGFQLEEQVDVSSLAPAPADQAVIDLLDGLKPGDKLGGIAVVAVGAVDRDGLIGIHLLQERQGLSSLGVRLVVAQKSDEPPPPLYTAKYAVYYQALGPLKAPMPEELNKALRELVDRLKRTEDRVPTPARLGRLKKPGSPA